MCLAFHSPLLVTFNQQMKSTHTLAWTYTRLATPVRTHFHTSLWKSSNRFFVMKDRREKTFHWKVWRILWNLILRGFNAALYYHTEHLFSPWKLQSSVYFIIFCEDNNSWRFPWHLCHWWEPLIFPNQRNNLFSCVLLLRENYVEFWDCSFL